MPAEVDEILGQKEYCKLLSQEAYRYGRYISTVPLINIETGKTDFVHKTKIKEELK